MIRFKNNICNGNKGEGKCAAITYDVWNYQVGDDWDEKPLLSNITIYTRPTKSYVRRFLNKWSTKFQNLFFGLIFLFSLPRYLVFSGIGGLVLSDEGLQSD